MMKTLLMIIYLFVGVGTWAGFYSVYTKTCPNDKFTFGPVVAGIMWPMFAGLTIANSVSGFVPNTDNICGNKF